MFLCCVETIPVKIGFFLQIFKVAQKSGQRPWAIVQGISSKMAPREFSIFIFFLDAYTSCYVA